MDEFKRVTQMLNLTVHPSVKSSCRTRLKELRNELQLLTVYDEEEQSISTSSYYSTLQPPEREHHQFVVVQEHRYEEEEKQSIQEHRYEEEKKQSIQEEEQQSIPSETCSNWFGVPFEVQPGSQMASVVSCIQEPHSVMSCVQEPHSVVSCVQELHYEEEKKQSIQEEEKQSIPSVTCSNWFGIPVDVKPGSKAASVVSRIQILVAFLV